MPEAKTAPCCVEGCYHSDAPNYDEERQVYMCNYCLSQLDEMYPNGATDEEVDCFIAGKYVPDPIDVIEQFKLVK